MLKTHRISEISEGVVRALVAKNDLERVLTQPATDSEGNAALRITLVLKPTAAQALSGDKALDLLVGIQERLRAEGEERFPIVEYATEQELLSEESPDEADLTEDDA